MADLHLGELVDPASHERTGTAAAVPTGDLTTHGVIVGMTGSGKTGLGVVLIEEAMTAGVPCLLIDPKGDLTNLCLMFPDLAPADFRPWINEGDAQKAGVTPDAFAEQQATTWKDGLAGWGITPDRIKALRDSVRTTIYTPGSTAGVPLNIVGSLQAPADTSDMEVVRDEIEGYVSGLLGLVGISADPLSSREHILLSNLIETAWTQGHSLDLGMLVGQVQQPPLRKLGVFDLDQFFPPADRTQLAIKLNGLLASPSFSAWSAGPPLDVAAMLRAPDGKPSAAIVTIAHLSDEERQFVVALLLSKVITWMRKQSGTTDLRALVYMDEVMGYVPPTAEPPTKKPIMTLMKQARAFGVGMVLATQNPVDIDYKAISNAGTWMVGRLQTERDKARLLDGMSAADGGVDVQTVGATIGGLAKREFVLRRAGQQAPVVLTSRWAMSYLRGPLTRDQIASLMASQREAAAAPVAAAPVEAGAVEAGPAVASPAAAAVSAVVASGTTDDATPMMPEVAQGVTVTWVDQAAPWLSAVGGATGTDRRAAAAVARIRLRYDDERADLVADEEYEVVLHPLTATADPAAAAAVDYDDRDLQPAAPGPVNYVLPAAPIEEDLLVDAREGSRGAAGTVPDDGDLRQPPAQALLPGRRDEGRVHRPLPRRRLPPRRTRRRPSCRDKYETKVRGLQEKLQTAQDRADVLAEEASGRQQEELLSTAGSLLDSFLGGRKRQLQAGRRAAERGRTPVPIERRRRAARRRAEQGRGPSARRSAELETTLSDDLLRITVRVGREGGGDRLRPGEPGTHRHPGRPARAGLGPRGLSRAS